MFLQNKLMKHTFRNLVYTMDYHVFLLYVLKEAYNVVSIRRAENSIILFPDQTAPPPSEL